jgi:hypothetical protein
VRDCDGFMDRVWSPPTIKCPRTAHTAGGVAPKGQTFGATGTLSDKQAASQPRQTSPLGASNVRRAA